MADGAPPLPSSPHPRPLQASPAALSLVQPRGGCPAAMGDDRGARGEQRSLRSPNPEASSLSPGAPADLWPEPALLCKVHFLRPASPRAGPCALPASLAAACRGWSGMGSRGPLRHCFCSPGGSPESVPPGPPCHLRADPCSPHSVAAHCRLPFSLREVAPDATPASTLAGTPGRVHRLGGREGVLTGGQGNQERDPKKRGQELVLLLPGRAGRRGVMLGFSSLSLCLSAQDVGGPRTSGPEHSFVTARGQLSDICLWELAFQRRKCRA